jgi:cystathionine beta-lyase/cystathionine gamma-synthase
MKQPEPGLSTRAIHGSLVRRLSQSPINTPVYQSATFVNQVGSSDEVLYTRYGNNPNQTAIAKRLAALEGADAAIFLASGMGATALAHLAVLQPGDHLLATDWVYGGTRVLFTRELSRLGIDVTFVDPSSAREWRNRMTKRTRAIFVETPTNPLARVLDLEPLAKLCQVEGMVLIVDSTFATPMNFRPIEHGADIIIHSATKYLNGHSDVIAGAVVSNNDVIAVVRGLLKAWGQSIDPHAAWLVDRGMKTLAIRMAEHNRNGLAFARWAAEHPRISAVHYPGLEQHPDHELARKMLDGFGGIVGLQLDGGPAVSERVLRRLRLASHAPSLGGVETLVSEPRVTSHAASTAKERKAQGFPDGFIRVSVGIEDVADLIADFKRALSGT